MSRDAEAGSRGIDVAIRIAVLALLLAGCFFVLEPFAVILGWALVMSVALYPTFGRVSG